MTLGPRSRTISDDKAFSDCVVLDREAFDPDAVFLDDIVDDGVLPYLSLAVDGLNDAGMRRRREALELRPEDVAPPPEPPPAVLPDTPYDPEQLEVYGWESSFWRKIRGYFGF